VRVLPFSFLGQRLPPGTRPRAEYGEQVIEDLSAQLLARVGRGYSTRNLWYVRDFYLTCRERAPSIRAEVFRTSLVQNSQADRPAKILHEAGAEFARRFSSHLSWTHYRALLKVSDPAARAFYEIEGERESWSTPHLELQIFTALHLRLLKSRNKAGVMELARVPSRPPPTSPTTCGRGAPRRGRRRRRGRGSRSSGSGGD